MSILQRLWTNPGGLKLAEHKIQASSQIVTPQTGEQLIIPLQQHAGSKPKLQVKVGDLVNKGQVLAHSEGGGSVPIHASTSGTILAINAHPIAHPSGLQDECIILQADGQDDWGNQRMPAWSDYSQHSADALRQRICDAGIVGLGGAVFPSAIKLKVRSHIPIQTLVINGAECEPYISCDDCLMQEEADAIVQGIEVMRHILGQPACLIGIEDNKPQAIQAMQTAVTQANTQSIDIISVPTLYPSGGEKQLIHIVTGKEVPSRGRPADVGVICHNVATARAIYHAVVLGEPLISRYITVTGNGIQQPSNFNAPLGTSFRKLAQLAGGYQTGEQTLRMGGPMMGVAFEDDTAPMVKASNCLLVRPKATLPKPSSMPCIRCGRCAEVCPASLLPQQLYWHSQAKDFEQAEHYHLFDCIECGCCSHVCPSHIPLVDYYRFAKAEVRNKQQTQQKAELARERHEFRQHRIERDKREKAEKLAAHKKALQAKKAAEASEGSEQQATDPKKAAIQAALARAQAKKTALQQAKQQDKDQ